MRNSSTKSTLSLKKNYHLLNSDSDNEFPGLSMSIVTLASSHGLLSLVPYSIDTQLNISVLGPRAA